MDLFSECNAISIRRVKTFWDEARAENDCLFIWATCLKFPPEKVRHGSVIVQRIATVTSFSLKCEARGITQLARCAPRLLVAHRE